MNRQWISGASVRAVVPLLCGCLYTFALAACISAPNTLESAKIQGDVEQTIVDNKAGAEAEAELTLLNIVRAYEHEPGYYVGFQSWSQSLPYWTGSGTLNFPFPLTGSTTLKRTSSTSQSNIEAMVGAQFERGFTAPISTKTLIYYENQGYPVSVLLHLFVRKIDVFNGKHLFREFVNSPLSSVAYPKFDAVVNDLAACRWKVTTEHTNLGPPVSATDARSLKGQVNAAAKGYVLISKTTQGGHKVYYVAKPGDSDIQFVPPLGASDVPGKAEFCKAGRAQLGFQVPSGPKSRKKSPLTVKMELRSPEATMYYLGEVVRRELLGNWSSEKQKFDRKMFSVGAIRYVHHQTCKSYKHGCYTRECLDLFVIMYRTNIEPETPWYWTSHGGCYLQPTVSPSPRTVLLAPVKITALKPMKEEDPVYVAVTKGDFTYAIPQCEGNDMDTAIVFTLLDQVINLQSTTYPLPATSYVRVLP